MIEPTFRPRTHAGSKTRLAIELFRGAEKALRGRPRPVKILEHQAPLVLRTFSELSEPQRR